MPTMTPEDIRFIRTKLKLTQIEMADMLGYGSGTRISELENGVREISPTAARLMVAYASGYRPDDWPKRKDPRL